MHRHRAVRLLQCRSDLCFNVEGIEDTASRSFDQVPKPVGITEIGCRRPRLVVLVVRQKKGATVARDVDRAARAVRWQGSNSLQIAVGQVDPLPLKYLRIERRSRTAPDKLL